MGMTVKTSMQHAWMWLLAAMMLSLAVGCVNDTPDRLEPSITDPLASDITRNEATLTASVTVRGIGGLSHFRFVYGLDDAMDLATEEAEYRSGTIEVRIEGLIPGRRYGFRCEGWNDVSSATICSETAYLTTFPNERPTLTEAKVLSSGPTGLIAYFEITDDGGAPVTAAGFMVSRSGESVAQCHSVAEGELAKSKLRAYIGGLSPEMDYEIVAFAENDEGRTLTEILKFRTQEGIVLSEPGVLETIMGSESHTYDRLSISGPLDGDDLHYLRLMLGAPCRDGKESAIHSVRKLNLNDVSITAGGGTYDDMRYAEADVVGTGMLADCPLLEEVILPSSVTAIRRDAFSRSPGLRRIEIPASVTDLLPSSECFSLEEIAVLDANRSYKSADGILFDISGRSMIWYPAGKEGAVIFPYGMTSIGENALRGCRITSLTFPPTLEELGRGCLSGTGIESIVIPDGVSNIPEALFQGCRSLTDITFGRGTKYIGDYAFDGCPVAHLRIDAEIPPVVCDDTFPSDDTDFFGRCILHVPEGSLDIYRNHAKWQQFSNITIE